MTIDAIAICFTLIACTLLIARRIFDLVWAIRHIVTIIYSVHDGAAQTVRGEWKRCGYKLRKEP